MTDCHFDLTYFWEDGWLIIPLDEETYLMRCPEWVATLPHCFQCQPQQWICVNEQLGDEEEILDFVRRHGLHVEAPRRRWGTRTRHEAPS